MKPLLEANPILASRRTFLKSLGAGILIVVSVGVVVAQQAPAGRGGQGGRGARGGGGRGGGNVSIAARVHIGKDGAITVMTGKVECGQGARAEITQAAAEELRVGVGQIQLIMGDTSMAPDDGGTFGSQTTPRSLPTIRQGAAGARAVLESVAAARWGVPVAQVEARDGKVIHFGSNRQFTYGELAGDDSAKVFASTGLGSTRPRAVMVTPVTEWKVMGTSVTRNDASDLVTGRHQYPTDITRPGMLYGKVLRPPSYGATLSKIDLSAATAISGVVAVRDGDFVGVAAANSFIARQAIDALSKTAVWQEKPQVASSQAYEHLRSTARNAPVNPFEAEMGGAHQALRQVYHVAYVQHAPMEPRAAVAEWSDGHLTVWTGTQNPFGVKGELQQALGLGSDAVRVIVPDFGGGFGGKHTGEAALEAARLAKAAAKPVWHRWTREEEFMWAYFRPAAVIQTEAGLDANGAINSWYFLNINSGPSGLATPYAIAKNQAQTVNADTPLRQSSYRGLAATANHFARESFMDELAAAAGVDPLTFRLNHLQDERLIACLKAVAARFDFLNRWNKRDPSIGIGLAAGTEKGSYLATCAEVAIDRKSGTIVPRKVCQVFECGKIVNPAGLMSQVQGAIVMGLGPALRERMEFGNGRITNGTFTDYLVPRFEDLPDLDVQLLDRPDIASAGAGETPIVGIAPAIANAVFHATGVRVREMPVRLAGA
jgi:isoquinoline 1-oxidoreductase